MAGAVARRDQGALRGRVGGDVGRIRCQTQEGDHGKEEHRARQDTDLPKFVLLFCAQRTPLPFRFALAARAS